ncbi:hypothetical protein Sar04_35580 [Salinispora arenicola]|uniref:Uncharacterized protein n=1 Tax=Salinispora arenicola TaxID=168697 RepID=A0ABQ4JY38_SALAC|nr:hypothetical protein Sar04_35580 [Salinispora arenicola]
MRMGTPSVDGSTGGVRPGRDADIELVRVALRGRRQITSRDAEERTLVTISPRTGSHPARERGTSALALVDAHALDAYRAPHVRPGGGRRDDGRAGVSGAEEDRYRGQRQR